MSYRGKRLSGKMPMVRATSGHFVPWDKRAIVKSLLKETALAKDFLGTTAISKRRAEEIALRVERKVGGMDLKFVSGPLIREIVNNVLLEEFGNPDYRVYRNIMTRVGTPVYDAFEIDIGEGFESKENANLQPNAETSHKKKADKTSKEEYLLLMPMGQSDAHLSGDIHIHDLEYFGTRPFCQNWDLRYFFYYGFMPDGLGFKTSVAGPAKRPEVAVLHSVKVLAAAQTNFSGGEGFYNYLVFLAPYMRGLGYDGMKQLMQMMFFELTQMYVARGGQPVFSNIQIMPSVPEIWSDMPVVHGGKVGPDTYGSYQDEVRLLYRAINEVALKGDYWGKPFNFPKLENAITLGTFGPEVEDELLLTHKIAAKFGSPYFDNMIPEYRGYGKGVSCYQCLAGDELVPVVGDRGEVQVRRIEDLFNAAAKNGLETDPNGVEFAGLRARTPSIDFKTLKGSLKAFHGVMRKKYKGKLLNVTLASGRRIRITPDHPVFVLERGTFVKWLARDLNVGDYLPVLKSADFGTKWVHVLDVGEILNNAGFSSEVIISEDEVNLKNPKKPGLPKQIPVSSELIRFLGYYLAEGCSDHHGRRYSVRLSFGKHETDLIEDALRCLRTLGFNSHTSIEKTASNVVVNSKPLYLLMEALGCGHNAHDKSVPDLLFNVKPSLVGEYISCAFQGDGNINVQVDELEGYAHAAHGISMRLVSRDAIQKLVFLTQRIGVQMNYMARDETVKHPQTGESYELTSYTCYITSQDQIKRFYHDTGYGKDAVSDNGGNTGGTFTRIPIKESAISYSGLKYPSQYGSKKYNTVNQRLILEDAKVGTLRKLIEGDIHPLMIRNIVEDDYGGYVYDLVEVSDNHNFSNALGILIGNCCSYNFVETSDTDDKFKEKMHFSEGAHFSMGSWQVVTLNLPRAAYRARGEDERLFEELRGLMDLSMEVFETKRRWMDLMLKNERMPFATQRPMDPSGGKRGPPAVDFEELVYTIGLVGANEMAQYHTGSQLHESDESVKLAVRAILEMKKHLGLLSERTGMKLALARTPAESCAQRLAVCDLLSDELRDKARVTVKGDLKAARKMLGQGGRDVPVYYSNGTHVYVGAKMPLMERMRIENKFFPILNGGNMFHVWLGERDPDPESLLRMTKRISTQSQIGYFAYTRDLTICEDCNKVEGGVHKACPSCRSPRVRWWSRVTGYYQDVGGWNSGKKEEFLQRFRTAIPRAS